MKSRAIFLLLAACVAAGCGTNESDRDSAAKVGAPLAAVPGQVLASLRENQASIAVKTLRELHLQNQTDNVLCSPSGIHAVATAMALGADGAALADLEKLVGKGAAKSLESYRPRAVDVGTRGVLSGETVLFYEASDLSPTYAKEFEITFGTKPRKTSLNSGKIPDVDAWIAAQTHNRVTAYGPMEPEITGGLLLDVKFFRDRWAVQFDKTKTTDGAFKLANGAKVQVPMMRGKDIKFEFSKTDEFERLVIPFRSSLKLVVLIPQKGIESLLKSSDLELALKTTVTVKGLRVMPDKGRITMPKWKHSDELNLKNLLVSLGLTNIFTQRAIVDFGKMFTNNESWPCAGKQILGLEIDEEGGEAHAITSTQFATGGLELEHRVDQPFIFAIVDPEGPIHFAGIVMDPR